MKNGAYLFILTIVIVAIASYARFRLSIKGTLQKKYDHAIELEMKKDMSAYKEMQAPDYFHRDRTGKVIQRDEDNRRTQETLEKGFDSIEFWHVNIQKIKITSLNRAVLTVQHDLIFYVIEPSGKKKRIEVEADPVTETWSKNSGAWQLQRTEEALDTGG